MRTATEDPQRTDSWRAFSMRPLRRLQKVTYVCPEVVADVVAEADVVVSGEDLVESRC
ncbi:hypothetical protein F2Q70_00010787 [Brassica cretica]|uniref:Uncharacterized protein n=1 Tax=Brassica cretica TaxID=69181 RepID=A0A8S9LWR1_BRACR|nr:hypothetical protein F2Q70_00010787 [Brassica cretica]